jgi:hypothetical protein
MSLGANKQALMGAAGSGGAADDFYDHQISKSFRFESGYLKYDNKLCILPQQKLILIQVQHYIVILLHGNI